MNDARSKPRIHVFDTSDELARSAATLFLATADRAVRERGDCVIVLSGGETPRGVYRRLAIESPRHRIAWERVHLLFGDERVVPPEDPLSTFGMVRTELLSQIQGVQVHRVDGELEPVVAAERYALDLMPFLDRPGRGFDLVLLGIGEDGHTASLFPAITTPPEWSRPIAAVPGPRAWRVTMTPELLNNTQEAVFLVTGSQKAAIVKTILEMHEPSPAFPASLIRPRGGDALWLLDRAAAAALPVNVQRSDP